MTLTDTGPLVALLNRNDPHHARCSTHLVSLPDAPLLTTWPCFVEAMYLLGRGRTDRQATLWEMWHRKDLRLHDLSDREITRASELMVRYRDIPMDLADASLMVVADSLSLDLVFTLDRHFHAYRTDDGRALTVVP